ncbi:MAG: hypothetical protein RIS20_1069 [Bacteroidota bacterium]|jgi:hypothetical protein
MIIHIYLILVNVDKNKRLSPIITFITIMISKGNFRKLFVLTKLKSSMRILILENKFYFLEFIQRYKQKYTLLRV